MNDYQIISTAKEAISTELNGINLLFNTINDNFVDAIKLITKVKGRVILSGVGKSGHIAKKIAATLASTGTPSFFVHPTEALHGDLGMITTCDCVILISNSGNSVEINGIINFCLKNSISIIGITSNAESTLAKASNSVLILPQAKEACPFNKAPTTSTTMSIILGDCIAVTLLKYKNFSCEDFKSFHPGGSLGNSLKKIGEIMHTENNLPLIESGSSMKDALITITSKRFGCVAVINEYGFMIGIITDGDLRRHISNNMLELNVDEVMTKNFLYISEQKFAAEALALMKSKKITQLFVLNEQKKPIGIIHIHDLTNVL